MHRPDAAAHRHRAGEPPADPRPAARLANPSRQVERDERRHDRDRDGQQDQAGIVMAVQRRLRDRMSPSGIVAIPTAGASNGADHVHNNGSIDLPEG